MIKKILICADNHGDHIDTQTSKAFLRRKEDWKPDIIVHLGDAFDLTAIRSGATAEDRAVSMIDDYHAGVAFLEQCFKGKQKNYFLWGNHDWRLHVTAESSDGVRADAANMVIDKLNYFFRKNKVKTTPFDTRNGILRIGELAFIHGYAHGMYAAKQHAEVYGGKAKAVFAGDLHARLYWRSISIDPVECYHIPCMTHLDPEYARRHRSKLRHSQGWCEITDYGKDGYEVQIIEKRKSGKFICQEGTKQY